MKKKGATNQIQVVCEDCLKYLPQLPANSVDLIIADPPYNLGKDYGNSSDRKAFSQYLEFSRSWLNEAERVLKDTGTIYVFMGVRFIAYIFDILSRELDMPFNSWITWHYTQGLGKTKGFSSRHDDILMFTKSNEFTFNLDAIRVPQKFYRSINNMNGANPGDVWQFSHVHYCHANRANHPTQKPEGLMERMILASSQPDDLILDPFSGSGTTLRVAKHLGRRAIGIELNADYIAETHRRLCEPFTGFDSIDERMARVPRDLNDAAIRANYLDFHQKTFLKNHQGSHLIFSKEVERVYGGKKPVNVTE